MYYHAMNVQCMPASPRPVEWADLWRHPSSMSHTGHSANIAVKSTQMSEAITGVNSPTQCWQIPWNGFSKCQIQMRIGGGSSNYALPVLCHGWYKNVESPPVNVRHGEQVCHMWFITTMRSHAVSCDTCQRWTHRICGTGIVHMFTAFLV